MRLPGGDAAIVDLDKLTGYCLNPDHPRGKHKARVFAATLGLTSEHAVILRTAPPHRGGDGGCGALGVQRVRRPLRATGRDAGADRKRRDRQRLDRPPGRRSTTFPPATCFVR